ncbi:MAG: hypothetical protein NTY12_01465 [Candidatus Falkowbacteria bacterium]|nr:hypothetical protein [Candidatus Falkowbacteria bacterium]
MPEKRKVPVRRTRRVASGNITVKKQLDDETIHVVNLKKPLVSARVIEEPIMRTPTSVGPGHWSFRLYRKIAISFILVAIAILGLVAYFATVKLEIDITPKVVAVKASSSFEVYDRPETYTLPASSILGIVREMELEYSGTYPTSGGEVTGAEVSGHVIIVNNYIKDQPLVATTRLLTASNQMLRLKNNVVVPAGGSVEAEVYGESADPSFALADAKLTIPGLWAGLQDKIYAQAKAGDVTYRETKKTIVTQDDLDKALAGAKQALLEKATADIESVYSAYDEKLYELDDKSISFSFDSKVGDDKSEIKISMNSKVIVVAFKKDSLVNLNKTTLESGLKDGQALVDDANTKPTFKVTSADPINNIAQVELLVDGTSTAKSETDLIDRGKLVGLNRKQVESYLDGLDGIASYELHFTPSFLEIAPQLADRITVKLK